MPLPAPTFQGESYRELLGDALARIPSHTPEWTNQSDADPGVTLLQLFAFMSESIIYRANRIPERNRQKFLRLLGIPMQAPQPARGFVTFDNPKGPLETIVLDENRHVQAGQVPFRTQNGLAVLPIETRIYIKRPIQEPRRSEIQAVYNRLYASYEQAGQTLQFYETREYELPDRGVNLPSIDLADEDETVDGSMWIALLARNREEVSRVPGVIAGQMLTLGILPALVGDRSSAFPRNESAADDGPRLVFEMPNTNTNEAAYVQLPPRQSAENPLLRPGLIEIELPAINGLKTWTNFDPLEDGTGDFPPSLEETEDQERLISWLRVRVDGDEATRRQATAKISWVGINAAWTIQQTRVDSERLLDGTGEPDQTATLVNTPVAVDTLRVTINGKTWRRIDDLNVAPPEVSPNIPRLANLFGSNEFRRTIDTEGEPDSTSATRAADAAKVYVVDRESGEIQFGNGIRGARPPAGAIVEAAYEYGGGSAGMVAIGSISKAPLLPNLKVSNPVPTWGADNGETIGDAEARIHNVIRHRNRIVSVDDCRELAMSTPGVDVGRIEVLPLVHPDAPRSESEGVVTVLAIPARDPRQPDAPRPDRLFLETICRHLEPRRVLTTELHVVGPQYKPLWVSMGIEVVPGFDTAPVIEQTAIRLRRFLSPLSGGFLGNGWPLNKSVEPGEVAAAATRVDGVAKVNGVRLAGEGGNVEGPIEMVGLELPRLMKVSVTPGDPRDPDELRGRQPPPEQPGGGFVPVPVPPDVC